MFVQSHPTSSLTNFFFLENLVSKAYCLVFLGLLFFGVPVKNVKTMVKKIQFYQAEP